MKIQVLGPGCKSCNQLADNVAEAVSAMGVECEIEKVTDFNQIMSLGVMMTPGLVVDGTVKAVGRVPSVEELKTMLK
ncbi:thioredoxin family protein [Desulfopila aestuarii]|uniref:Small redox-active disulfide protein 2 n=1 Tax=Desulfopila aestuarii DSM 18488 TaxID=1121416 RepID=A0A1M7XXG0_9BACT|nr:thioredoxin family protein [Desulfopila aestuarii]SHO43625.1 small redox-active disulfide protein 2 [Desulfopila aestuarii DSM 18488]